ncbi:MAG: hypothetical protein WBQ17_10270 [Rhizomicrobium sp.]
MKGILKATTALIADVRRDLSRPHAFAAERVGFLLVRAAQAADDLVLIADSYEPVRDEDYINDRSVGAMMGPEAIRRALEKALLNSVGVFHVHMHEHVGRPRFSGIDRREQSKFVPDFFKVRNDMPHGAIVLSLDSMSGTIWLGPGETVLIDEIIEVGPKLNFYNPNDLGSKADFSA